jgi:hypothetical protein
LLFSLIVYDWILYFPISPGIQSSTRNTRAGGAVEKSDKHHHSLIN